jgi:hypothetical protein
MKKTSLPIVLLTVTLIILGSCNNPSSTTSTTDSTSAKMNMAPASSAAVADLHTAMRKLWEDHITWTRDVICCLVDGLPGADQAVNRLMQNQEDIGNAVKPYYGDDAGKQLAGLLHNHIAISADVVTSAKAGDKAKLDNANNRWTANADSISDFLSKANPNWSNADMKTMMHDHLKLTTDEAVARIKKDYNADIQAYDKVHDEILKMADMLSDGIVKQFPDKFK